MKRGILIVLMAFLGLTSVMAAQKVTLKCREVALKEIFARITKQTGLMVAYSSQVLNVDTKISIETENAEITEVLEKLLPATIGHFQLAPLGSSYLKHSIYIGNGTYGWIIIQNQCYACQPFPRLLIKNNSLHPDCRSFLGNFFFEYQD